MRAIRPLPCWSASGSGWRTAWTYDEAVQQVRATSVFTTHTPVPAGHDVFPFDLIDKYICHCYPMLDWPGRTSSNWGPPPRTRPAPVST